MRKTAMIIGAFGTVITAAIAAKAVKYINKLSYAKGYADGAFYSFDETFDALRQKSEECRNTEENYNELLGRYCRLVKNFKNLSEDYEELRDRNDDSDYDFDDDETFDALRQKSDDDKNTKEDYNVLLNKYYKLINDYEKLSADYEELLYGDTD